MFWPKGGEGGGERPVQNTIHVNQAEIMAANIQPTTHGQTDVDADPSDQKSDMKITMNLPKKISLLFDCRYKFDLIYMCIMTSALKKQCSDNSCLLETWSVRIWVMGLGGWVARWGGGGVVVICIQMAAFVDLKQTIASRYCKQMPTHKPAFKSSVHTTVASTELGEFMRSTRIIILSS